MGEEETRRDETYLSMTTAGVWFAMVEDDAADGARRNSRNCRRESFVEMVSNAMGGCSL